MNEDAVAELKKAVQLSGGSPTCIANLAQAYVGSGKEATQKSCLAIFRKRSTPGYSHASEIVVIYTSLGDTDLAMSRIERGHEERFSPGASLRPGFDPLRSNRDFKSWPAGSAYLADLENFVRGLREKRLNA